MASSKINTAQYSSEQFVESCGAVLFNLSTPKKVCLIHYTAKNEWLLAKGRRDCGESRAQAAIREVMEETGFHCHLLPIKMPTRAPSMQEAADVPDKVRTYADLTESFMLRIREIDKNKNVKLIWWFVAKLNESPEGKRGKGEGENEFVPVFLDFEEALDRLTFQGDRNVLQRAVMLVEQ